MAEGILRNVAIAGVACAVPKQIKTAENFKDLFGEKNVDKFVKMVGVKSFCVAAEKQTVSDLCYAAAQKLMQQLGWESESVDGLIMVTQTPDYPMPATACILQSRLGLPKTAIAFDICLGCSGFIYGLYTAGSMLRADGCQRILLMCGDTFSKRVSPYDKSCTMLFGDAGAVAALEYNEGKKIPYALYTNGDGGKAIMIPAGGSRQMHGSIERTEREDGTIRNDYDFHMNGWDVFNFTIGEVPQTMQEFIVRHNIKNEDYDYFIPHQANLYMLKQIAKKVGIDAERMLVSLDKYGNTNSASIPLTMCQWLGGRQGVCRLLVSGFGVGLSWGHMVLEIEMDQCLNIITVEDVVQGDLQ